MDIIFGNVAYKYLVTLNPIDFFASPDLMYRQWFLCHVCVISVFIKKLNLGGFRWY